MLLHVVDELIVPVAYRCAASLVHDAAQSLFMYTSALLIVAPFMSADTGTVKYVRALNAPLQVDQSHYPIGRSSVVIQ
jgi:hypothetical protein